MKKRLYTHTSICWLIAAGAASILGIASGQDAAEARPKVIAIAAGSDYLQTATGTEAALPLNGKMVTVKLTGVPIQGPVPLGNSDTIIERTQDAIFAPATGDAAPDVAQTVSVPITLTALSMTGTVDAASPHDGKCTATVTLAPSPASTGSLILSKASPTATSGSYTSNINVYFMVTFSPITPNTTCYPPIMNPAPCQFTQLSGSWSTSQVSGEFLYTGTYPGVQYNQHNMLPAGYADFYITKPQTDTAATAKHATCEALAAAGTPCPKKGTT
jgi:hypothetical protein